MSQAQNNDFVIESSSRIRTRLPGEVLNAYISDTAIINDLNLSISNVSDIPYENSQKTSLATQTYTASISPDQLYSTCIIKRSTLSIDITGIKTPYNQNVLNIFTFISATDAGNNVIYSADAEYKTHRNTHFESTLPHTYLPGIWGTVCDPLNSSVVTNNVTIGTTASQVNQQIDTPATCDINRNFRSEDQEELYNNFDGILNPDTNNIAYTNKIVELKKTITGTVLNYATGLVQGFESANGVVNWAYSLNSNMLTLDEVNNDMENALSVHKRGRLLCPDRATYKFTKSIQSPNYSCSAAGVISIDANPTYELYTCIVGNYQFPTNVRNWQIAVALGVPIEMFFFYFNKPKWFATAVAEPVGQSLNINILIKDVESPILNPILDNTFRKVFSNASSALIRFSMHPDIERFIFQSCGKLTNQTIHDFAAGAEIGDISPNYGNISARWSDSPFFSVSM